MPVLFHNEKIILFVHVPKTGGSAVEHFLTENYGPLSLIDHSGWSVRNSTDSTFATSPQHMAANDVAKVFPAEKIDYTFAIVRDPLKRLVSEYNFSGSSSGLWRRFGFSVWMEMYMTAARLCPNIHDNHIRPQTDLIPFDAEVFKFEDGMETILDQLATRLGPGNEFRPGAPVNASKKTPITVYAEDIDRVNDFYKEDFERFGYEFASPESAPKRKFNFAVRLLGGALGRVRALMHRFRLGNMKLGAGS